MLGRDGCRCFGRHLLQDLNHSALLVRAEFGEDRQAEDLGAEALSDGQRAGRIVQVGVGRLAVDRNWVVDDRRDAGVLELLLEPVAAAGLR